MQIAPGIFEFGRLGPDLRTFLLFSLIVHDFSSKKFDISLNFKLFQPPRPSGHNLGPSGTSPDLPTSLESNSENSIV